MTCLGWCSSDDYNCLAREGGGLAVVNGRGRGKGLILCWSHRLHWQEVDAKLIIDLFS